MTTSEFRLGTILARYETEPRTGRTQLILLPYSRRHDVAIRRPHISGVEVDAYAAALKTKFPAVALDSLVQVKTVGDAYAPAFSQGRTLRDSETVDRLTLVSIEKHVEPDGGIRVRATLRHPAGWLAHHDLTWPRGASWLASTVTLHNTSAAPITLELLSSFSLGGLTPFCSDDAPGRLRLHRLRSVWSMEGRLETRLLEELQLERSWVGWGARCERFGQAGNLPVNGFFPFVAIEDSVAGVTWGAQLAHPGSWQLEVYRRGDTVALSGGLADREFGQWSKQLGPDESFVTPTAHLACVSGDLDALCDALTAAQAPPLLRQPRVEAALPIIFNEWATTWGRPTHANMVALARTLRTLNAGIRYLVIDAGWFAPPDRDWSESHGDWIPSALHYPQGIRTTADALRAEGFVPGIWFEFETAALASDVVGNTHWFLKRDGLPITGGKRRFLDLRNPEVIEYLAIKVIKTIRDGDFGYLKIDYNESCGPGVDGPGSPGENLRQHLAAAQAFITRIRKELPDLVIENCSSGGHRLEPSMLALTAMSSFSDAHEGTEIPIIAANLHRVLLPRQNQIWAVLRSGEDYHRTIYSLTAGFLGRLCLSGDFLHLDSAQASAVRTACALYRRCAATIKRGHSRRHGPEVMSYRHATGWQAVLRLRHDNREAIVVAHSFGGDSPREISLSLPSGAWAIADVLTSEPKRRPRLRARRLVIPSGTPWRGLVIRLVRQR